MFTILATILGAVAAVKPDSTPSQCPCGYRDASTGLTYTESIIVYFNETDVVDTSVFHVLDYSYNNQKGWNVIFRQGASPSNVGINGTDLPAWQAPPNGSSKSLEMWLDGIRFDHLSDGAELRSSRQDILYGTFRASMRSAQPWVGGSAMSMYLKYNDSNSLEMDM